MINYLLLASKADFSRMKYNNKLNVCTACGSRRLNSLEKNLYRETLAFTIFNRPIPQAVLTRLALHWHLL